MAYGIVICGLNGCGKSTLGRILAKRTGYKHLEIEDYVFKKSDIPYSEKYSKEETEQLLYDEIKDCGGFILTLVGPDISERIEAEYDLAVILHAPKADRIYRVKQREYANHGSRVLPGGDMYEQNERFIQFVSARDEAEVIRRCEKLTCPVVHIDAVQPIEKVADEAENYIRLYKPQEEK